MGNTIAIMQPYLWPHLAYFQMINAADIFVVYDNVEYSKQSWINRNRLDRDIRFTLPLIKKPKGTLICDMEIAWNSFNYKKFSKTLEQLYCGSINYDEINSHVSHLLSTRMLSISELAIESLKFFCERLNIKTQILRSSELGIDNTSDRSTRIMNICHSLGGDSYINSFGGFHLYDKNIFRQSGIKLMFYEALPSLSIIHDSMTLTKEQISARLERDLNLK